MRWGARGRSLILGLGILGVVSVVGDGAAATRSRAANSPTDLVKRVALVIGNDHYKTLPSLNNAGKDAQDIAARLKALGFEVVLETDASANDIARALARFERSLSGAAAGLVFYAGHGIQADGKNYLIPSDAEIEFEEDLRFKGIEAVEFMESMARAGAPVNLLILDACRDNPLKRRTRSAARGLTIVQVPRFVNGAAILYSAGPGEAAQDGGPGANGVFTGALLSALDIPGRSVEQVFKDTARRVREATGGRQTPWNNSSLTGDFYFVPPSDNGEDRSSPEPASTEVVLWQSIQSSRNPAMFDQFLQQFPNGQFAAFARIKIAELKGTRTASLTLPTAPARPLASNIREAQRLLSDLGYSPGLADGVMGSRTQRAIEQFQRSNGTTADGSVSDALLEQLRQARPQTAAIRSAPAPMPEIQAAPAVGIYFGPGQTFRDCAECPEMVVIPPGSFEMGSNDGKPDEKPVHRVNIQYSFAVGKYEVTQAEWRAVMGSNPSQFLGDRNPVEQVSWSDAKEFVRKLTAKTGHTYRLLSESEWEFVARAGARTRSWCGDSESCLSSVAVYGDNAGAQTAPVGTKGANAFGIHDTAGNVWEWTEDCWNDNYDRAPTDGKENTNGDCYSRVHRGGSWHYLPESPLAGRRWISAEFRDCRLGFRVARDLTAREGAERVDSGALRADKPREQFAGSQDADPNRSSRIVIRANSDSWIQIRDGSVRRLLVTRLLRADESFTVPDRSGLTLLTGNAGTLEIYVDGQKAPSIGSEGAVRRNVSLDPERLLKGSAVVD